jgi:hypothetical protein
MDGLILETVSATAIASLLTNLFKLAWPAAPSVALVVVALVVGIGSSILVGVANGAVLDGQVVAQMVVQGIIAAGGAAGLDRTSQAASEKREEAKP